MKFQFLILLALVGFGASQNFIIINNCVQQTLNTLAASGDYSEEVINEATTDLANLATCGPLLTCLPNILNGLGDSGFANEFNQLFNSCVVALGGILG
ncbi:unnamed protein product [Caenorhabditis nigoni]